LGVPQANELAAEAVVLQYTDWLDQDNPVKNREALDDIVGDHNVVCPLMHFAQRWAERGGTPLNPGLNYTAEEEALSRRIMRYWGNFARTGYGHGEGEEGRRWPSYTASGQSYARLNARPLAVAQGLRAQACAFWTRFLPKLLNVTGPMEEAERQWRLEFHRWSSYMMRWKSQFELYSRQERCQPL
ncbi:ACES Acetylcholinesterase, partial [Leiothrix lutea]|nr:ACES Acetylcholinesterase [Leiothrix lutea]